MSGEFYFFCKDCFSQWVVDGQDYDIRDNMHCYSCDSSNIAGGDLGYEGDMVSDILGFIKDSREYHHEDTTEYEDLFKRMADKYFRLNEFREYDEDDFTEEHL